MDTEKIVDEFVLRLVENGMVLLLREQLIAMAERTALTNAAALKAASRLNDPKVTMAEIPNLIKIIKLANTNTKLYNAMLDDSKIVIQTMITLKKVLVENSKKQDLKEDRDN